MRRGSSLEACDALADRAQFAGNGQRCGTLRCRGGFSGCKPCQAIEAGLQHKQPAIQISSLRANRPDRVPRFLEFPFHSLLKIRQPMNDRQNLLECADEASHRGLPGVPFPPALLYFIQGRVDLPELQLNLRKNSTIATRGRFLRRPGLLRGACPTTQRGRLGRQRRTHTLVCRSLWHGVHIAPSGLNGNRERQPTRPIVSVRLPRCSLTRRSAPTFATRAWEVK